MELVNDQKSVALRCSDIRFSYQDEIMALNGISLTIKDGEKVGVIGPNGAGKSTFLSLLNGIRSARGLLEIYGVPVCKKKSAKVKSLVGLVFQNPDDQLFCPTIFEDVAFGPFNLGFSKDEIKKRVETALLEVGLSGCNTRSSLHLSYGERKLAAIATILSMSPKIIAMDEPTSNLDPKHRRKIINWINKNNQTIIITSHDLDMLLHTCQRIIVFNKGVIMKDDLAEVILRDKKLLENNDLELPLSMQ